MRARKDLLFGAFGSELDWEFAAPLLEGLLSGGGMMTAAALVTNSGNVTTGC